MPKPRQYRVHQVLPMPWELPTDRQRGLFVLEEKWGLKNGMRITDGVDEYFYVKIASGGEKRQRPEVWCYKYYKNGNTRSTLSRLSEWRVVE